MNKYFCYIISNLNDLTYNGYTTNLKRRIRQHNGIIKGGAKATKNKDPWTYLAILTSCDWDCISVAMQHEWSIKYPTRCRPRPKHYNGELGRLNSLEHVFVHMQKKNCNNISCYVIEKYYDHVKIITSKYDFITIFKMDDLDF
jgi:predicted GIY-YIG superfamily endonuclease